MNKPKKLSLIIIGLVAVGLIAGLATKINHNHNASQEKGVYYCPMHPTYTSIKPGDCPICNMKLVKRETPADLPQSQSQKTSKRLEDICLMHNCPKLHDGRPCPMLVVAKAGERVTCPLCGTHVIEDTSALKKKILYWTDPMIPGFKADKPGKSPMGMDLIPVYEEETPSAAASVAAPEGYAPILVTPQKQQLIGVKTAPVERRKLTKTIRTVGTVAHDPELYQAEAEYIQAIQAFERAKQSSIPDIVEQSRKLVESTKIRLKHMGLNDELIAEMAAWKEPEHGLLIAQPGEPVWMYAKVYEYELPLIRVGQSISVDIPSLPGQIFEGTIRAIDLMVDSVTRTTRIRAQLKDPQGQLKPDMYVNATIQVDLGEVLAISEESVLDTGTKKIVFVDKGQGLFEPRDVILGQKADEFYEVRGGVTQGEKVVTGGNFLIDSESRLKAALEGMAGPTGEHHHGQ